MFQKAFSINRKELLALGISTAKELRLYDEGEWIEHITRVEWNKQKFAREGILYREDIKRRKKAGELEHIPGKAEIKKIYFDTSGSLPLLPIRERIQELRIAVEASGIGDSLTMCEWPGGELIGVTARTVAELAVVQRRHSACFRMLQRILNSDNSSGNTQIVQKLQNLKCLANLHFRILKWQIESGQRLGDAIDTQYAMKNEEVQLNPTEDQVELLQWFADQYPTITYVTRFNKYDNKTKYKAVKPLVQFGFLERPQGKKQGYIITTKGRSLLEKHYSL